MSQDIHITDLESALRIDEHALEKARREHPELFYKAARKLAKLLSARDGAKKNLKEIEAQVSIDIRRTAEIHDKKATDKTVEAETCIDPEVRAARLDLHNIEREYNDWVALKEAYEARGYAIRDLVELYIANYYGADMEKAGRSMLSVKAEDVRRQREQKYAERPRMRNATR